MEVDIKKYDLYGQTMTQDILHKKLLVLKVSKRHLLQTHLKMMLMCMQLLFSVLHKISNQKSDFLSPLKHCSVFMISFDANCKAVHLNVIFFG